MLESPLELALYLFAFLAGWLVGWIQTREPLLKKIDFLQSAGMERVLLFEDLYRKEQEKVQWLEAKVQAQESDLERMNQKLLSSGGLELPQHRGLYWKMEFEKSQRRVSDLEMELAKAQDQLMWRLQ